MKHRKSLRRLPGLTAATSVLLLLAGCAGVSARDYAGSMPRFTLKNFFNGPILATGVFQDRSGKVVRRFHARLRGEWHGDRGVLREHFDYLGEAPDQARVWQLTQIDPHHFGGTGSGSAGDIVGTAEGRGYGYALHWSYDVDLPVEDTTYRVHFDDWMWMVDPNTVIDRSVVTKYGFTVGTLSMVMQKVDPDTGRVLGPSVQAPSSK